MYRYLLTAVLVFFSTADLSAQAQSADYPSFPKMDVDYLHLDLQLKVSEDLLVEGNALYKIEALRGGLDSLSLDASGIEVQQLEWNGEERDYRMKDDRLVVLLPGAWGANDEAELRVIYRTSPEFGLHVDSSGTIWASLLPGSVRHWLPAFDHPRNTLTTDVRIVYPSGKQVVMNGSSSDSEVENVDFQSLRFTTEFPLAVTTLSFAIGDFEQSRTTVGRHQLYLHSHNGILSEDQRGVLLELAYNTFRSAENHTGSGFPWRTLHIVVLEDDRGETKNYGTGILYLYHNRGNLEGQLKRGVASQWFGIQLREEQWSDAAAIRLLQTWLNRDLSVDGDSGDKQYPESEDIKKRAGFSDSTGIYAVFSPYMELKWKNYYQSEQAGDLRDAVSRTAPLILSQKTGVINWYDFAHLVYEQTGQPFLTAPEPRVISEQETEESYHYTATFTLDEAERTLRMIFNAENRSSDELIPAIATEMTRQDTVRHELAFTGQTDEIVMNVNPAIENLKLSITGDASVRLDIQKPFMFWIYQLRNDEDPAAREKAARNLREFADNPDLQLALLDFLSDETYPGVQAEIIRTLSAVVGGAFGTEQLFLDRYRSESPTVVQQAIVESLAGYEGNEQVISRLQQILVQSEDEKLKEQAAHSLGAVTEANRFRNIIESLQSREEVRPVIPFLLNQLAGKGEAEAAVEIAEFFLSADHAYKLRSGALDVLLAYDRSAIHWEQRIPALLDDSDPRIRFEAAAGLQYFPDDTRRNLIENRLLNEYDVRVRQRLSQYLSE
ncbi:MAG: HEAT repeat domain-containing protein [Balneolaceae bacterium]